MSNLTLYLPKFKQFPPKILKVGKEFVDFEIITNDDNFYKLEVPADVFTGKEKEIRLYDKDNRLLSSCVFVTDLQEETEENRIYVYDEE